MRRGTTRTLEDVQRELAIDSTVGFRPTYEAFSYSTPHQISATSFTRYGGALFQIETQPGDLVDIEYFLEASSGTATASVTARFVRADVIPVGVRRSAVMSTSSTSGTERVIHGRIREAPPKGVNSYTFQWLQTGAAIAYSAGAEFFITLYEA